MKLGVLASGKGSNFDVIAALTQTGQLPAHIQVVVYNNPGAAVADKAQARGIVARLLDHRRYASREVFDQALVDILLAYGVELVVMAGWMRLVTPTLIEAFPDRIINIHPSLLPSFKGAKAIEQALAYGVKVTGCTVHFVDMEMDTGAIIAQRVVPVLAEDTTQTLGARIQLEEHQLFPQVIGQLARGEVQRIGRQVLIKDAGL